MAGRQRQIVVLGAGPVGALLASLLARRGHRVEVFERRADLRRTELAGGRSINLACSDRGFRALDRAGLGERVRQAAIPMGGRMVHDRAGGLTFLPYGSEGQAIYAISRGLLNRMLIDHAEQQGVRFHFEQRCTEVDLDRGQLTLALADERRTIGAEVVFGADGARSELRAAMQRRDRFELSQHFIAHGYKELTIPPRADGGFAMEQGALHIWPRGELMLIALPNDDGSFTCTLFLPFEGEGSFAALDGPEQVARFFEQKFPDARALMPSLLEEFFVNPTSSLITIRCYPWVEQGRWALIGDAAHAVVPFYGQGMNAGFEDCTVLDQCLSERGEDWAVALADYQQRRKPDADAIAELALQNFVEMRDHVRDPAFRLKKRIERRLQQLLPGRFIPLYSLVTFSHTPYAEALRRGRQQEMLLERLAGLREIDQRLEDQDFAPQIVAVYDAWLVEQRRG